ncbi:MAG: hypothetical protein E3J87_11075 [Candidatus Cloacimonadota bacterium]|nr:MAG: hypothetical protein E3J87_11075 [Candidatus Cloacimonadota bacterium]
MMDLKTVWNKAYWLYNFAEMHRNPHESYPFTSMEQLWLAFYMWEKHEKTWDGEKWDVGSLKKIT